MVFLHMSIEQFVIGWVISIFLSYIIQMWAFRKEGEVPNSSLVLFAIYGMFVPWLNVLGSIILLISAYATGKDARRSYHKFYLIRKK